MVKWTRHARTQLHDIHDYVALDSRFYARRVVDLIAARAEGLDELPRMGRIVSELNRETVRELSELSWRILHEIRAEGPPADIEILTVIHKRRDLRSGEILHVRESVAIKDAA